MCHWSEWSPVYIIEVSYCIYSIKLCIMSCITSWLTWVERRMVWCCVSRTDSGGCLGTGWTVCCFSIWRNFPAESSRFLKQTHVDAIQTSRPGYVRHVQAWEIFPVVGQNIEVIYFVFSLLGLSGIHGMCGNTIFVRKLVLTGVTADCVSY